MLTAAARFIRHAAMLLSDITRCRHAFDVYSAIFFSCRHYAAMPLSHVVILRAIMLI